MIGARVSAILAILLALVGMIAFYVEHTALDEDGFETISRNMIENDEIRTQVAAKSVDTLFENVDVEAAIAERLPAAHRFLPVSPARAPSRAADAALERPHPDGIGRGDNRTQRQLVRLLDDDTTFIQTEGGAVVLDLRPDRDRRSGNQVAVIGKVAERLPESAGRSRDHRGEPAGDRADGHEYPACGRGLDVARRTRRRRSRRVARPRAAQAEGFRAIALGLLVVGLLMLAVRRFARVLPRDEVPHRTTRSSRQRGRTWTSSRGCWPTAPGCGSSSAWCTLAESGSWATRLALPERAAPQPRPWRTARRPTGIAAVALIALVLVAPQIARGWLSAVILIGLVVAGIEVVRTMVQREADRPV